MNNPEIVDFDTLKELLAKPDAKRVSAKQIEKALDSNRIKFFQSYRGPWTTLTLINAAGGISNLQSQKEDSIL